MSQKFNALYPRKPFIKMRQARAVSTIVLRVALLPIMLGLLVFWPLATSKRPMNTMCSVVGHVPSKAKTVNGSQHAPAPAPQGQSHRYQLSTSASVLTSCVSKHLSKGAAERFHQAVALTR